MSDERDNNGRTAAEPSTRWDMDDDLQVDTELMSAFTPQTPAVEAGVGASDLLF